MRIASPAAFFRKIAGVEPKGTPLPTPPPAPNVSLAPLGPVPMDVQAKRRDQAIRYELLANDGRYCDNTRVTAMRDQVDMTPKPLMWAVIPLGPASQAKMFGPKGDKETERLSSALFREMQLPGWDAPKSVALLPVHWEEAKTMEKKFPSLRFIEDGKIYRGASPRSLFVSPKEGEGPKIVEGLEQYSLKMHLSIETYNRLGGLGGNRDINMNDALMASVIDHVAHSLLPKMSPYLGFQSEARTVAVKVEEGKNSQEIGMIFRKLTDADVIPGFALYSKTNESLPHAPKPAASVAVRTQQEGETLAAKAIDIAMKKNPGMSKLDAIDRLFAEPMYDVIFSMAKEGLTMELHPQNFMLHFDPKTGLTDKLIVRDLHGMGYSAAWREKHGKDDVFSPEALKKAFPDITQKDLDGYFTREGKLRDRYEAPGMFQNTLDFFSAMFFYHIFSSLHEDGHMTKEEVDQAVERVKDRMEQKAVEHGFDLRLLDKPGKRNKSFWVAEEKGIRGQVLFRRSEPQVHV